MIMLCETCRQHADDPEYVCDRCRHNLRVESDQAAEIKRLKLQLAACIKFISTEMDWCDFRGEMLADNASVKNAKMLAEFLDKQEKKTT